MVSYRQEVINMVAFVEKLLEQKRTIFYQGRMKSNGSALREVLGSCLYRGVYPKDELLGALVSVDACDFFERALQWEERASIFHMLFKLFGAENVMFNASRLQWLEDLYGVAQDHHRKADRKMQPLLYSFTKMVSSQLRRAIDGISTRSCNPD